jgi:hypothetical protein
LRTKGKRAKGSSADAFQIDEVLVPWCAFCGEPLIAPSGRDRQGDSTCHRECLDRYLDQDNFWENVRRLNEEQDRLLQETVRSFTEQQWWWSTRKQEK